MELNKKLRLNTKKNILSYIVLFAIVSISFFLRYEDFSTWKNDKKAFQYQQEYQMGNFDSYLYLQTAENLQNGTYDDINEKRRVPNGMERRAIPPLISILAYGVSSITGLSIPYVAIFTPVVLSSLLAIVMFFVCISLGLNRSSSLVASFFSIISISYIIRSRIGVFDTDSMNVIFPLINSYLLYIFSIRIDKSRYKYLVFAILNTFLYFMWWDTSSSIVIISFVVPFSVSLIFFYKTERKLLKLGIIASVALVSLFFIQEQLISYLSLFLDKKNNIFPNNMDISELNSTDMSSFVKGTINNEFVLLLAGMGFIYFIVRQKLKALIYIVPLTLGLSPFIIGNRFIIFSAPVIALSIAYFIQLFDNIRINKYIIYLASMVIILTGFTSNYEKITKGHQKGSASENTILLDALDKYTPKKANIWTDSDMGYQIQYYLDRGTFADGEFSDGELYYYLYFPLAANNLALSANYMQFYNAHGIKGMNDLYPIFGSTNKTFIFLSQILSLKPKEAKKRLEILDKNKKLPFYGKLTSVNKWLKHLFPKNKNDIYLLIHHKMTQTASWFKQGNSDLITGKTKGMPLFMVFKNMKEEKGRIKNSQININMNSGVADYMNSKRNFKSITSYYKDKDPSKLEFGNKQTTNSKSFEFKWNKNTGVGAAMSQEMANTSLVKLYFSNKGNDYFEAIHMKSPIYQIWKIKADSLNDK